MIGALDVYERALADPELPLIATGAGGGSSALGVNAWLAPVTDVDERALAGLSGPVLDVGCGPGRHVRALARRGVLAVGVDVSPAAVSLARSRGTPALQASVFDHIPGSGTWRSALLLDGNIGIGGCPTLLLRRIASLLAPHGEVLVELAAAGSGLEAARVRLQHGGVRSDWFSWSVVGLDAIDEPAAGAGLGVVDRWSDCDRHFALLRRR